jgi:glucose-6-phosphate isomerase
MTHISGPSVFPYTHKLLGVFESGALSEKVYDESLRETQEALESLRREGGEGKLAMLEAAFWQNDLSALSSVGAAYKKFHSVLIIGMGGASLGGKALSALFQSWVMSDSSFPFLYFIDNLDPEIFWEIMSVLNPRTTGVIVISKSGETPETLIQLMRCVEYWQEFLSSYEMSSHFTVITSSGKNTLNKIGKNFRFTVLEHPKDIGGRFSCLSVVGLLPLFIVGGDPRKVRHGAGHVLKRVFEDKISPPVEGVACLWGLYQEKNLMSHVMMSYGDAFGPFAQWHRQLWAESLGKEGIGFLPVTAMGPMDQHSQLQLYLDGPKDKFFTVLSEKQLVREKPKPEIWADFPELNFLAYASLEDLLHAERMATTRVLIERGAPVREIEVSSFNEVTIGALFSHFILETLLMGILLKIDPLTQPAVDAGKILAKKFLLNPSSADQEKAS